MLDWILIGIAFAAGGGDTGEVLLDVTQAAPTAFQAEVQTPTGKFTTATEVKPILNATRSSWVALREYEGQDLLYVTHLLSWRCGLLQLKYAVNGGAMQIWELPPCLIDTASPNAILTENGLPFRAFDLGSVRQIDVEIIYDDLSRDTAHFERPEVLMP